MRPSADATAFDDIAKISPSSNRSSCLLTAWIRMATKSSLGLINEVFRDKTCMINPHEHVICILVFAGFLISVDHMRQNEYDFFVYVSLGCRFSSGAISFDADFYVLRKQSGLTLPTISYCIIERHFNYFSAMESFSNFYIYLGSYCCMFGRNVTHTNTAL